MIYELRTYWAAPGKQDALHARFRTLTCRLFAKHGMQIVGFWVPDTPTTETGDLVLACHEGLGEEFVRRYARVPASDARTSLVASAASRRIPYEGSEVSAEGLLATLVFPVRHEGRLLACLNVASRHVHAWRTATRHCRPADRSSGVRPERRLARA